MNIGLRLFTCAVYLTGDVFTEIGYIFFHKFFILLMENLHSFKQSGIINERLLYKGEGVT
jgi:hypothetical protein